MENNDLIRELKNLSAQEIAEKCIKEGISLVVEDGKVVGVKHNE